MVEEEAAKDVQEVLPRVRRRAETDREVLEKGTNAFVSYVRGYREHQVDMTSLQAPSQHTSACKSAHVWSCRLFRDHHWELMLPALCRSVFELRSLAHGKGKKLWQGN